MNPFFSWVEQHPVLFTTIIWPTLTAIITTLFKPRTPEKYAQMNPVAASVVKLVASVGIDVPNLLDALGQLIQRRTTPADTYRASRGPEHQPPYDTKGSQK